MDNILFDKLTKGVVGVSRSPLPFEFGIKEVDIKDLTKEISYFEDVAKTDVDGNELYLLLQESVEEIEIIEKQVETFESEGNEPVMIIVSEKEPLLNDEGEHVGYFPTSIITEEVEIGQDDEGNPIYETQEKEVVGAEIKCYTTVEKEVQKEIDGQLVYLTTVQEEIVKLIEQPSIEITSEDERFVEGLEKAMVQVEKTKIISFEESMNDFNFNDVVEHKLINHLNSSEVDNLIADALVDDSIIDRNKENFVDTGFGQFILKQGGVFTTKPYALEESAKDFTILLAEGGEGLEIYVNDVKAVDSKVSLPQVTNEIYVTFKNPLDKTAILSIFAIGY